MGFWSSLFGRNDRLVGKQAVRRDDAPSNGAKAAPDNGVNAGQCQAITASGAQCTFTSRDASKYCGRHKNYRAGSTTATTNGNKQATAGRTQVSGKQATAGRTQVSRGEYRLFQKGNRYFFSKKAPSDVDGTPVYSMPKDRVVKTTTNGLPVLAKK